MNPDIERYNEGQSRQDQAIVALLAEVISSELPEAESKIWHAHPVWFLDQNPIVGYSKQNAGIRFMFWSGADFDEAALNVRGEKFKDASVFYTEAVQVDRNAVARWLAKARTIQWDYKNIVKRKGHLERLK